MRVTSSCLPRWEDRLAIFGEPPCDGKNRQLLVRAMLPFQTIEQSLQLESRGRGYPLVQGTKNARMGVATARVQTHYESPGLPESVSRAEEAPGRICPDLESQSVAALAGAIDAGVLSVDIESSFDLHPQT